MLTRFTMNGAMEKVNTVIPNSRLLLSANARRPENTMIHVVSDVMLISYILSL